MALVAIVLLEQNSGIAHAFWVVGIFRTIENQAMLLTHSTPEL
jgi:hypothetical protein